MKKTISITALAVALLILLILGIALSLGSLGNNHSTEVNKPQEPQAGETLIYDNSGSFLKKIETDPASSDKSASR